jgi:hypothetical protein
MGWFDLFSYYFHQKFFLSVINATFAPELLKIDLQTKTQHEKGN